MKKFLKITLPVLLVFGLLVACSADVVEIVFDTSYKVQSDGSWKMGVKVYEPSTKPYILVLPKTLDVDKEVQLEDLEAGLKTLDMIRSANEAVPIGSESATVQLKYDNLGNEYYNYVNSGVESKAQNIFMRTTDNDFTETILLDAPYDEFSHYGSLNVATVDKIAPNSYYEYGQVRKVVLSIGHLVAEATSNIDLIFVKTNDPSKVSVDIETTSVKGIVAPEAVLNKINTPDSVTAVKTEAAKYLDSDGNFYDTITKTKGNKVTLLADLTEDLTIERTVEIDMFGNEISGQLTISQDSEVTFSDSVGQGSLDKEPQGEKTFEITSGNYGFNPTQYLKDKENTKAEKIQQKSGFFRVVKKTVNPGLLTEIPEDMFCFIAAEAGASVQLAKYGEPYSISLVYSVNGGKWETYTIDDVISLEKQDDKVYFRAEDANETFSKNIEDYYYFVLSNEMSCSGNIMYLLDSTGTSTTVSSEYAFESLFSGCATLTSAPSLPATTLAVGCYKSMFYGCTSLSKAPALPATTLVEGCYSHMFCGCSALVEGPTLPAQQLIIDCYDSMFEDCTSLSSLTVGFEDWAPKEVGSSATRDWLKNTSSSGTFYCPSSLNTETPGVSSVPSGWNIVKDPLCFTAEEAGASVKLVKNGSPKDISLEYFKNGDSDWSEYSIGSEIILGAIGDKVYFKAKDNNANFSQGYSAYYQFVLGDKKVSCSGNIMYLLDANGITTTVPEYAFVYLFQDCTSLTSVPNLPATTLGEACYSCMFDSCTGLTSLPEGLLPAKKMEDNCYRCMFYECSGLTSIPAGLFTTTELAEYCYYEMFNSCTGLTSIPEELLPVAKLAKNCYDGMFAECTSLESIPSGLLPATDLAESCYYEMFFKCTSLTTAPSLCAGTLAKKCYGSMFYGCTSLTTAPDLPATELKEGCYESMFEDCSKLEFIKVSFKSWGSGNETTDMFKKAGVPTEDGGFTIVCPKELVSSGAGNFPSNSKTVLLTKTLFDLIGDVGSTKIYTEIPETVWKTKDSKRALFKKGTDSSIKSLRIMNYKDVGYNKGYTFSDVLDKDATLTDSGDYKWEMQGDFACEFTFIMENGVVKSIVVTIGNSTDNDNYGGTFYPPTQTT